MSLAPPPAIASASSGNKPVQTVYVNNLPDKMSKDRLRRQLFNLFSRFGAVLDVIVKKTKVTRGQAWIVFATIESATRAISSLQSFLFFEKEMRLSFAKENADLVTRLEGKFVQRGKREAKPEQEQQAKKQKLVAEAAEEKQEQEPPPQQQGAGGGHDSNNPPGPVLKTDNLPSDVSSELLTELFSRFDGFKEVRLAPGKFIAFVEYSTVDQAKLAREGLKGYQLTPTHRLRVNYAKQ